MYAGRIVEQGPVAAVLAAPLHPYTRGLIGSLPGGLRAVRRSTRFPACRRPRRTCRRAARSRRAAGAPTRPADAAPAMVSFPGGRAARCWHPHAVAETVA